MDESRRPTRIANALPGETIAACDVSIKRHRQAYLQEVAAPSPDRCEPRCSQWRRCPACQFQCLPIESQEVLKKGNWIRLIQKFVDIPESCRVEFLPAIQHTGYRHRTDAVVFSRSSGHIIGIAPRLDAAAYEVLQHAQEQNIADFDLSALEAEDIFAFGYLQPIELCSCLLHAPELNALIAATQNKIRAFDIPGNTRLGFEAFGQNGRITFYAMPETASQVRRIAQELCGEPGISVIFQELPPKGSHVYPRPECLTESPWYCYTTDIRKDPLYALKGAWTPVNPNNAALIRSTLSDMARDMEFTDILEIGCGCGTHTSVFAQHCRNYTGIDASWPAIQSAQYNASCNHWQNAVFYTDTAEHYLDKRYYSGRRSDGILMHSNRMPYSAKTAQLCKRFGAATIFIVAPTAYAMAMECRHFTEIGYRLDRLTLCDTLPMTYHMMAVAKLSR